MTSDCLVVEQHLYAQRWGYTRSRRGLRSYCLTLLMQVAQVVFGWMFSVHSASGSFFRDPLPLTAGCLDIFFHCCHDRCPIGLMFMPDTLTNHEGHLLVLGLNVSSVAILSVQNG